MLEGVDKAGKTTQCMKLVQALQEKGHPAEMMRFPGKAYYNDLIVFSMVHVPYITLKK